MRKPRILFVATVDRFVRFIMPHAIACRKLGWTVDVACHATFFADELSGAFDTVHETPFSRSPLSPSNVRAYRRLVDVLRANPYDIVHSHTPAGGFIGRAAAAKTNVPVKLYTAHGFHFHPQGGRLANSVFVALERYAGQHWSDSVEVMNRIDYDAALSYNIVPRSRLRLVNGVGVDTARFDPNTLGENARREVRAELGIPDAASVIGYVAEFVPRKRQNDAIAVVKRLRDGGRECHLVLAGEGPLRREIERLAQASGVGDLCHFTGFRRDTPRIFAALDAFLFPSRQEGLPVALIEAMSMRLPSVATRIRGNEDVIVDGVNGTLVHLSDIDGMACAIRSLLDGQEHAAKIGAQARSDVERKYSLESVLTDRISDYRRLLDAALLSGRLDSDCEVREAIDVL
jgi:glycosyltransferase involved in cell wall biosynthesis